MVLDSCSIRQYLTHEREDELPVVRSIWTRNYAKKKIFPSVKQPNTVNGLAAAGKLCFCFFFSNSRLGIFVHAQSISKRGKKSAVKWIERVLLKR